MVCRRFVVSNPMGLHARPAGEIAKVASGFASDIQVVYGGRVCNAKSMIHLSAACIRAGEALVVEATGPDEWEAMDALEQVISVQLG